MIMIHRCLYFFYSIIELNVYPNTQFAFKYQLMRFLKIYSLFLAIKLWAKTLLLLFSTPLSLNI